MKNQYFGDINDYRKYGLLRAIQAATDLRLLVAWMLTPDDERADGLRTSYLKNTERWSKFDPELFHGLQELASGAQRSVSLIELSDLLPRTEFYSPIVRDSRSERASWAANLLARAVAADVVFLDPDNGLDVKSVALGTKGSSKYLYWQEVRDLWNAGVSLVIYQHFPRVRREEFIPATVERLHREIGAPLVEAFATSHVLFLLAAQPDHAAKLESALPLIEENWGDELQICGFSRTDFAPRTVSNDLEVASDLSVARLTRAFGSAAEWHATDHRKSTTIPYISHLMAVAAIVLEAGGDEEQASAALLHDSIEDAPTPEAAALRRETIRRDFGERVARIVDGCTDGDPSLRKEISWRERKERYIAHLYKAGPDILLVSAADKLHNAQAILRDYKDIGGKLWDRFNADQVEVLWYYDALLAAYQRMSSTSSQHTGIAQQLAETLAELREKVSA